MFAPISFNNRAYLYQRRIKKNHNKTMRGRREEGERRGEDGREEGSGEERGEGDTYACARLVHSDQLLQPSPSLQHFFSVKDE